MGRDEEAFDILTTAVARDPDYFAGHLRLASLYGRAGQFEIAKMHAAEVRRFNPRFSLARAPAFYLTANPEFLDRFLTGFLQRDCQNVRFWHLADVRWPSE